MKLYLIKRSHHEGQTIHGIYDNEVDLNKRLDDLYTTYKRISKNEFEVITVTLNVGFELDSYDSVPW